jgi:hypothetical protein
MPRKPCNFRQSDVARAIRAAESAGKRVTATVVTATGDIRLEFSDTGMHHGGPRNEWDEAA